MPGTNLKTIKLTISYLKQTNFFLLKQKNLPQILTEVESRTFMTSRKELIVVISNDYKPVNSR